MSTNDRFAGGRNSSSSVPTSPSIGGSGRRAGARTKVSNHRSRTIYADRRRRRGRILIALVCLCIAELTAALLTSPMLNTRHIRVEGIAESSLLTPQEVDLIRHAASVQGTSNWLLASTGRVSAAETKLPWVRRASANRRLPLDLVAHLDIRTPAYALITNGYRFEMSDDNAPIRRLRPEMERRLKPIILHTSETPILARPTVNVSVRTAADILQRTQSDSILRVAKIEIDQSSIIWLNMSDGVKIKFGQCDQTDAKIAMMRKLLTHQREIRLSEINVSSPEWPAGRLQDTGNRHVHPVASTTTSDIGTSRYNTH